MKNFKKISLSLSIVFGLSAISALCGAETEKVLIYHTVKDETALKSVKQNGLYCSFGLMSRPWLNKKLHPDLSYMQLTKGTLSFLAYYAYQKMNKKLGFSDQWDVVYFKPEEPDIKTIANFAIQVDPNSTYVYNLNYRGGIDYDSTDEYQETDKLYRQSRVLLSQYLKYLDEAKQMVAARTDLEVQLDPETACPFYLELNDPRKNQVKINGQWVENEGIGCSNYSGEVIIARSHIPACELIPVQDNIGDWSDCKPVKNISR
ncbi:MAG: hypothetical protein NTZ68_03205 [Candidatus Dependentiae bacterium]|nr:hypothetical protein [Candidatus Dependentiae bacterium]